MFILIEKEDMIEIKSLSLDALCVPEKDMHKLKGDKAKKYKVFHDELGQIGKADIVTIEVEDMYYANYYADVKTGSLYDIETLRCLTGPLELK